MFLCPSLLAEAMAHSATENKALLYHNTTAVVVMLLSLIYPPRVPSYLGTLTRYKVAGVSCVMCVCECEV